jgi:preprotein translocase subunit SecE
MAEVRKKQTVKKYNIEDKIEENNKKNKKVKKAEKPVKKEEKKSSNEKKSLWTRFMIFCHGVKSEFQKVHWPSKENMIKYSIAVILFIIFCSLFFYLIDIIFAGIQAIFK